MTDQNVNIKQDTIVAHRRHDIDWLRIIAMLMVFLFHCSRFFGGGGWHLKNPGEESLIATIFIGMLDLWIMPLFFLLSGTGSWYALKSRTGGKYLLERVKRILIPLYGVGACLLLLPQAYFEAVTNGGFTGTFWEGLPLYIINVFTTPPDINDPFFFNIFYGHLWFLQCLFLISLIVLPILLFLKSEKGKSFLTKLAGLCGRRGGIFIFLIPLIVVKIIFMQIEGQEHSWSGLLYYAVFFIIGYIMPADERFTQGVKKAGWLCLVLGIIGFSVQGFMVFVMKYNYTHLYGPGVEPFSLKYVLFNCTMSIANWSWVAFILSIGAKYLNFKNKFVTYGNEAVLPFYILHQTIILCVGWFIIPLNINILFKFLIITVTSFAIIIVLYEFLIRRFNVIRFIFGMRKKKKQKNLPIKE